MKIFSFKWILLGVCMISICSACDNIVNYNKHYDDGTSSDGSPIISAVYAATDDSDSVALSSASFDEMVKVVGVNLSHVKKIMLNDVEISVKDVYATNKIAYFPIPSTLPQNVTNKLVYTTEKGETTFDFKVDVPLLQVDGLYNEFAQPGDTVQMVGKYFDLYGFGTDGTSSKIMMNDENVKIDSISSSYMSIIIPKDAKDNSVITLSWKENGELKTYNVPFRQTSGVLITDYLNAGLWSSDLKQYIMVGKDTKRPDPPYGNQYLRINSTFSDWSWNQIFGGGFNFSDEDVIAHPENYCFKFEANSATGYPFYDSGSAGYIFSLNGGANYAWNPSSGVSFNTYGKWKTISIPLSSVATKGMTTGWIAFSFVLQPNSTWTVQHNFADFRIEKIKY